MNQKYADSGRFVARASTAAAAALGSGALHEIFICQIKWFYYFISSHNSLSIVTFRVAEVQPL